MEESHSMTCWNNCVRMIDSGCIRTLRFSWFFMIFDDFHDFHYVLWFLMISHDFSWFLMISDDISWFLMVYHVFYDISWFLVIFMIFHNLHDLHDCHQYVASRQPNIINMLLRDSEILWYFMIFDDFWWFLMIFRDISWFSSICCFETAKYH